MKPEIRPSQLAELRDKVLKKNYRKYLLSTYISRLRGLQDATVAFDFPVTAIIGPNGGGKTTVLGAAACAYKSVLPRRFFPKSGKLDNSMANWQAEYEILDRDLRTETAVQRTASFKTERWRRDAPDREVLIFGVSRTVPASERAELKRCISPNFSVPQGDITTLDAPTVEAVKKVLGRDVSAFSEMLIDARGRVSLLAGSSKSGETFSEFHFGAGESSIIRMISAIEKASDQSLILIEEIENGLHPVATIRMVEYLIDVAERKRTQSIFTTHSQDALEPLPDYAVWAALDGKVRQGKLDIETLRAITGSIEASSVIFVEDDFAKDWMETSLRYFGNVILDALQVHKMHGSSNAVRIQKTRPSDPTITTESVCYLDGDAAEPPEPEFGIFKFPGSSPELYIFNKVLDEVDTLAPKVAVALHLPVERQGDVISAIKSVANTNRDPHLLYIQIGDQLGFISETIVRSAFLSIWAQNYIDEVKSIVEPIQSFLPMSGSPSPLTES